jgi:hypothetical protein
MTNQLDGDDYTAADVLDMLRQAVVRPREKAPRLPRCADWWW